MSITFNVCGVDEVKGFARAGLTDIVSFGDPKGYPQLCQHQPPPDFTLFSGANVYRFNIQDVCHSIETGPQQDDVQKLIEIADDLIARAKAGDVRVLFHCQAGVSRSTAAAFILLVRAGMTYQEAFDTVLKVRGFLKPNLLMIKYADQLMKQDGKMLRFVAENQLIHKEDALEWVRRNWS